MINGLEIDERGNRWWYRNGHLHREDGPAVEYSDGSGSWYLNNEYYGFKKPDNWDELVLISRASQLLDI
jgi:hypothetical protein